MMFSSEWDILNIRWKSLIGSRRVTTNSGVRWTQIAHHPLPNQVFHWKRFFSRWQVEKTTTVVIIAKRPNPITWSAHYYHAMFLKSLSVSRPMCVNKKQIFSPTWKIIPSSWKRKNFKLFSKALWWNWEICIQNRKSA